MYLGKLAYKFFFRPISPIRYHINHFGLTGWYRMHSGEQQMKKAALQLPPIILKGEDNLEVSYLTGAKYWHQTIFCAYTLAGLLNGRLRIKLYSDGTLTNEHIGFISKALPGVEAISEKQVTAHLNSILPQDKFPTLRYLRNWHPFFRRLVDIHTSPSWSIHLDSDMLFFEKPGQILDAYQHKSALYMKELLPYSYFVDQEETLMHKYGINCISAVNGGIIAYNNNLVDYADLEEKAKLLLKHYPNAGPAQVEQTLMSYLLHLQNAMALNEKQYTIFYDSQAKLDTPQVLRHYIFKAKLPYFNSEWKKILP